ncbi:MAG: RNA ligase family protein [Rhizonema sp. NSF051]|nr:RNA ligase family protein [Rhizonema sp. NSF051]
MSTFKVEVVEIDEVKHHPNADRLDLVTIKGMSYQVVTVRENFYPGDWAYYFPIDSVIPQNFVEEFGIESYYSKKLRAAKLRGIFSEGLLIPVWKMILKFQQNIPELGDDCTEFFGVTKYETPILSGMAGEPESPIGLCRFPSPENLKRYKDIFAEGEQVVVTEKIHGTNFTVMVDSDGVPHIGSHNYFWKNNDKNAKLVYVRAYHENEALQKLPPYTQVFGEIYGVQDLKYGLKNGEIAIAIFAVRLEEGFLDYEEFVGFCNQYFLPRVPILYNGGFNWDTISQFNNANSVVDSGTMMEGVVVQPLTERTHPDIGRVAMKLISDRYLLRKEGTELH